MDMHTEDARRIVLRAAKNSANVKRLTSRDMSPMKVAPPTTSSSSNGSAEASFNRLDGLEDEFQKVQPTFPTYS